MVNTLMMTVKSRSRSEMHYALIEIANNASKVILNT